MVSQTSHKLRVAAYCRVSTEKEDQINSFEAQCCYFKRYIEQNPDWNLVHIYADEGITGTSTEKRTQFNRMIDDAKCAAIDCIIAKEVSRFSRNLVDALNYTRQLKAMGIGVIFLNDGINTLEPDAELRLSIMAMIAQEESRKTSDRVQWGQQRQMERGVVFGGDLLGYTVTEGKITVEPEGAKTVKLIFELYARQKMSTEKIARFLNQRNITTRLGNCWDANTIAKILKNEKYAGDLVQQKTFTPNYLDHKRRPNRGEREFKIIRDHHDPIISRQLWDLAVKERELRRRAGAGSHTYSTRYWCSGKIRCGHCGAAFIASRKTTKDGSSYLRWACGRAIREGAVKRMDAEGGYIGCDVGIRLRDCVVKDMMRQVLAALVIDKRAFSQNLAMEARHHAHTKMFEDMQEIQALHEKKKTLEQKKRKVIELYTDEHISMKEYQAINAEYEQRSVRLERDLESLRASLVQNREGNLWDDVESWVFDVLTGTTQNELVYGRMLDCITVYQNRTAQLKLAADDQLWAFDLEGG